MKAEIRRAFHMLMFTKKKGEHDIRVDLSCPRQHCDSRFCAIMPSISTYFDEERWPPSFPERHCASAVPRRDTLQQNFNAVLAEVSTKQETGFSNTTKADIH